MKRLHMHETVMHRSGGPSGSRKSSVPGRRRDTSTILVLGKARHVLDCFSPEQPELTFSEVMRAADLPRATCFRLLHTLVEFGFLEKTDDLYRLSIQMVSWAAAATAPLPLVNRARPVLCRLRDATGETSALFIARDSTLMCVAAEQSPNEDSRDCAVTAGYVGPLDACSGGKTLLAFDSGLTAAAPPVPPGHRVGGAFPQNPLLNRELERIRMQGFATHIEEARTGPASISAPVFDRRGEAAGVISLIVPPPRFIPENERRWIRMVKRAAEEVSAGLSGEE